MTTRSTTRAVTRSTTRGTTSAVSGGPFEPAAPVFIIQPTNQTVDEGANATFTSRASGRPSPTYQWEVNDGGGWDTLGGATSRNLILTAVTAAMDGYQYRNVATNTEGTATSDIVTLTVTSDVPPWTLADLPSEIATEYFAAIVSNSGTISSENQTAVDTLLNALYDIGVYRRVRALYLFHGNTLNAARLNAINPGTWPGAWPITWVGTPTLNASGGFTPSGTAYGIAYHPDGLGLTSLTGGGLGFYGVNNDSAGEYSEGIYGEFFTAPKTGGGSGCALSNTFLATGADRDLSGFHFSCRERDFSSTLRIYRNGTEYANGTKAFLTSYNRFDYNYARIGGMLESPSTHYTATTPRRLSIATEGLTAAEVADLNTAIAAYIGALV